MAAGGMGVRDMPASRKDENLEQIRRDLIYIGPACKRSGIFIYRFGTG